MDKINLVNNILDDIKVKKAQSRKLVNSKNISAHRNLLTDIKNEEMKLYEMLDCVSNKSNLSADALICGMKHAVGLMPATEVDKHIFNYMKQSAGKDGGFLVPEDIQLDVKSLRNSAVNLESFVNVEPVITKEGTRFIELQADVFPLEEVPEGEIIPEIDESKIVKVKYKIKKRAGIIKMSNELLADSNEAILRWLKVWLGKKTRATRNKAILDAINKTTVGREIIINSDESLKKVLYKHLEHYNDGVTIVTNSCGYYYLDNLFDKSGNKVLKDDVQNKRKLLFGLYPVAKIADTLLTNEPVYDEGGSTVIAYKCPIICGNLEEAITLFDRENLSINLTEKGEVFFTDQVQIKVRDRIDVQVIDKDAIVKVQIQLTELPIEV